MSIADRPGLLVGFVGGFLATTGSTFANIAGDIPSGFLGALFAGFVGGYLMLGLMKLCDKLPDSLEGIKSVLIYPLVGLGLIAVIMCAVNPIMGALNTGLTNLLNSMHGSSKVILGCVLGAMMAIDMGGPFNKAAYAFGIAAITNGNYDIIDVYKRQLFVIVCLLASFVSVKVPKSSVMFFSAGIVMLSVELSMSFMVTSSEPVTESIAA